MTVEQYTAVVDLLQPLPEDVALGVWRRLQDQLVVDAEHGLVRPPARLRRLIGGWVIAADPDGAIERRKSSQDGAEVDYRRGDDGLVELFAPGAFPVPTPTPACPGSGRAPNRSVAPTTGPPASGAWTRWST